MVDYPQDSIQLMKKIMDVQEELDRFRVPFIFSNPNLVRVAPHHVVLPFKSPEAMGTTRNLLQSPERLQTTSTDIIKIPTSLI